MLTEFISPEFTALKRDIEAYPRLCGYYIVDLVSIRDFRVNEMPQEEILEKLVDHFDDDPKQSDPGIVLDHEWSDYETTLDRARDHTVEALVGGQQIGHTVQTMHELTARELFDRFVAVCGPSSRFYIGLGIGDQQYVFHYGVMIVARDVAGLLWIVESD